MIDQGHSSTNHYGVSPVTVRKNSTGQRLDALIRFADLDVLPPDVTFIGADVFGRQLADLPVDPCSVDRARLLVRLSAAMTDTTTGPSRLTDATT